MTSRPSSAAPIMAALGIVLALLGAYVAAYFGLGEYSRGFDMETDETVYVYRYYRHGWLTVTFRPCAMAESSIRGVDVHVAVQRPPFSTVDQ